MKFQKSFSLVLALVLIVSSFSMVAFADGMYTVKSGDVLWRIARDHGVSTQALATYNKLANPNLIYPGDELKIPGTTDESAAEDSGAPEAPATETPATETPADDGVQITLLHTNDMHGFFTEGKYDGMGISKIATFLQETKAKNPNTLMLDAGDALQGNNLVTVSNGETGAPIMNQVGYDAMVAGNHEFDYGWQQTIKLAGLLNFPMLSANVTRDDGSEFLKGYTTFDLEGVKVGVFGLTTPETSYKSHPDNTKGLKIGDIYSSGEAAVKKLKTMGAQVIVGLVHLGDEGDYTSDSLAKKVAGIDVIIDGHSHSTYETGKLVNGVLIGSAGEKTKNVGVINLTVKDGAITKKEASLFTKKMATDYTERADVLNAVNQAVAANAPILEKVVAKAPFELLGEKENVRKGETNLGNLLTESLLDISKADIAFTNGGGIRSSIPAGDITVGDVLTVLPFGNTVRVIELKGSDVIAALENGFSKYPEALGGFPHIAGMTASFDASKPAGARIVEVKVGGATIDPDKTYTLVTNDFLVAGGDNYTMFTGKNVVAEFGAMDEVLIDFITKNGFDKAKTDGRIKEIAN